jgi:hypothetical protein
MWTAFTNLIPTFVKAHYISFIKASRRSLSNNRFIVATQITNALHGPAKADDAARFTDAVFDLAVRRRQCRAVRPAYRILPVVTNMVCTVSSWALLYLTHEPSWCTRRVEISPHATWLVERNLHVLNVNKMYVSFCNTSSSLVASLSTDNVCFVLNA